MNIDPKLVDISDYKRSAKLFTPEELDNIGDTLGSAYYNIFHNILKNVPHPFVDIAKDQMQNAMKKLGLDSYCVD